jgi:NADH:ubiquinone oxidoreductase subunit 4 (subunit M)
VTSQPRIRRTGVGTVLLAAILIVVGGYYVLRNTLGIDLPQLDSDQVVPVIAVLAGLALLYRAWQDHGDATRGRLA